MPLETMITSSAYARCVMTGHRGGTLKGVTKAFRARDSTSAPITNKADDMDPLAVDPVTT